MRNWSLGVAWRTILNLIAMHKWVLFFIAWGFSLRNLLHKKIVIFSRNFLPIFLKFSSTCRAVGFSQSSAPHYFFVYRRRTLNTWLTSRALWYKIVCKTYEISYILECKTNYLIFFHLAPNVRFKKGNLNEI